MIQWGMKEGVPVDISNVEDPGAEGLYLTPADRQRRLKIIALSRQVKPGMDIGNDPTLGLRRILSAQYEAGRREFEGPPGMPQTGTLEPPVSPAALNTFQIWQTWTDQKPKGSGEPSIVDRVVVKRSKEATNNNTAPITPSNPEGTKPLKIPSFTPAEVKG